MQTLNPAAGHADGESVMLYAVVILQLHPLCTTFYRPLRLTSDRVPRHKDRSDDAFRSVCFRVRL